MMRFVRGSETGESSADDNDSAADRKGATRRR
jgi:hypothetical protein